MIYHAAIPADHREVEKHNIWEAILAHPAYCVADSSTDSSTGRVPVRRKVHPAPLWSAVGMVTGPDLSPQGVSHCLNRSQPVSTCLNLSQAVPGALPDAGETGEGV